MDKNTRTKILNHLFAARWGLSKTQVITQESLGAVQIEITEAIELIKNDIPLGVVSEKRFSEIPRELLAPNEQPRPLLVLIVGHEEKAQGAGMWPWKNGEPVERDTYTEYNYNSDVAAFAREYCEKMHRIDLEIVYRNGVGISGAYKKAADLKPDACIELHFNAFNGKVQGTETLCTMENEDQVLAGIVQRRVCKVFGREGFSRGTKSLPRNSRGAVNVYSLPGFANCLVEPFFGDNELDAKMALKNKKEYAEALVESAVEYFIHKNLF